jgi:hypothetical protein
VQRRVIPHAFDVHLRSKARGHDGTADWLQAAD